MINDKRYTNTDSAMMDSNKWSRDRKTFSGLTYIPLISEWEHFMIDKIQTIILLMRQIWYYSILIAILYVVIVVLLKKWIKIRGKPYDLRVSLILWNIALAIYSTLGVIRCLPQFIHILTTKGMLASYCLADYFWDPRLQVWYWTFHMSKVFELMDTMFIVLRGGKLNHLHWIHHTLTLCLCWYGSGYMMSTIQWSINMNFFVHSLMYSHYALTALRFTVPVIIRVGITTLQIIQMAFGIYINYSAFVRKLQSKPCDVSLDIVFLSLFIYVLFIILFVNYFTRTYIFKVNKLKNK